MLRSFTQHRLVKDSLVLLGVQFTGYVLPIITLPYLAQVLGPDNFGLLSLGTALVLYFSMVVEYGFAVTGPRRIALAQNDSAEISRIYSAVMACKMGLLGVAVIVLAGVLLWIPRYQAYWPLYALSFLQVVGWGVSPNWLLQGVQRMRLVAYADYSAKLISVVLIFVLVRQRGDYLWAATLQSGGFLTAAMIGLAMTFGWIGVRLVRPDWGLMRSMMIQGWPVFLSMVSMTVVVSTNTMVLDATSTKADVGYLAAAMRLMIASRALMNPISTVVYPHLSKLAAQDRQKGLEFIRQKLIWVPLPFLGISLILLFFSQQIVDVLYKAEYQEVSVLLRIMAGTPVMYAASSCLGTFLLAYGHEKQWAKIITQMMVLNFLVLAILLKVMMPVRAVALTTTLMDLFSLAAGYWYYRKVSKQYEEESRSI